MEIVFCSYNKTDSWCIIENDDNMKRSVEVTSTYHSINMPTMALAGLHMEGLVASLSNRPILGFSIMVATSPDTPPTMCTTPVWCIQTVTLTHVTSWEKRCKELLMYSKKRAKQATENEHLPLTSLKCLKQERHSDCLKIKKIRFWNHQVHHQIKIRKTWNDLLITCNV